MSEEEILEAARQIDNLSEQQEFIARACGSDRELLQRVERQLSPHAADAWEPLPAESTEQIVRFAPLEDVGIERELGLADGDSVLDEDGATELGFLIPSSKPGSIGRLGHYEVLEILGRGGFGIVFKAFDERLHRLVAIKVLSPQLAATSPPRKRFLREARSVAAIRHDNIVQIYSVDEQPLPYLAMEFIDGKTLLSKLNGSGPLEIHEILHLGRQIAAGLAAAHEKRLIHRDIKPGNILLDSGAEQRVKITDFGLARVADDASMTRTGTISGTPMYMAPEQALGQQLDHRADLFSLGSVLYQMACGRPPFRGANPLAVLKRVIDESPRPISQVLPDVPWWLCNIIEKLHAKAPADRYQSAREVADLLARCQLELQQTGKVTCVPRRIASPSFKPGETGSGTSRPWAARWAGRRLGLAALAGLAVLGTLALTQWIGPTRPASPSDTQGTTSVPAIPPNAADRAPVHTAAASPAPDVVSPAHPETLPVETGAMATDVSNAPDTSAAESATSPIKPAPAVVSAPITEIKHLEWQPIPVGQSPLDRLDPKAIPAQERVAGQPRELVAVIGSHAGRSWSSCGLDSVAFSPDKSLAASGTSEITIWDVATQTPKMVIPSRGFPWGEDYVPGTRSVRFLPDGKRLLCLRQANGTNLQLWDVSGSQAKLAPWGSTPRAEILWCPALAAWLTEAGQTAVTAVHEESLSTIMLRTYDLRGAHPQSRGRELEIASLFNTVVAEEAARVVYVTPQNKVQQALVRDGQFDAETELPIPLTAAGAVKAITPDGTRLVVVAEQELQIWDLSVTPPRITQRSTPGEKLFGINSQYAISSDGKWMTVKQGSTGLYRLDAEEPRRVAWLDQTSPTGFAAFSRDSQSLIETTCYGFVRFWELSGPEPRELSSFDPTTAFPAERVPPTWDPKQGAILLDRADTPEGRMRFQWWELGATVPMPGAMMDTASYGFPKCLGNERFVQISSPARLYQRRDAEITEVGEPFGSSLHAPGDVSPDGSLMVIAPDGPEPGLQLEGWSLVQETPRKAWTVSQTARRLSHFRVWFSPDNRWFATPTAADREGGPWKLLLWRNSEPQPEVHAMLSIDNPDNLYRAAFSPDGRLLAHTPRSFGEVVLVDLTGNEIRELGASTYHQVGGLVTNLAFHPNGQLLALGGELGVCLVDVTTLLPLWNWSSPGPIRWLDWAADGRHLVTHNGNQTVYVLRLDTDKLWRSFTDTLAANRTAAEWWLAQDSPDKSVRIAGRGAPVGNIHNREDLPASPFVISYADAQGVTSPVTDADLQRFWRMTELHGIHLDGSAIEVTDEGFTAFSLGPVAQSLRLLELSGASRLTDEGLAGVNRMLNLTALSVKGANISNSGLERLQLPGLVSIGIHGTSGMSLEWLRTLADRSPRMQGIGLDQIDLSHADLSGFEEFPYLSHLSLQGSQLTDRHLISTPSLRSLRLLFLSNNPQLSDAAFVWVAELPRLENLSIQGTGITDAGLEILARRETLKVIRLNGCKQITVEGVRKLRNAVPKCTIFCDFPEVSAGQ